VSTPGNRAIAVRVDLRVAAPNYPLRRRCTRNQEGESCSEFKVFSDAFGDPVPRNLSGDHPVLDSFPDILF